MIIQLVLNTCFKWTIIILIRNLMHHALLSDE